MAAPRRPRNIRDIAHLYLSRRPGAAERHCHLNLFVAAEDRDCLSGFHVANIAAAMASRGASVRVFELSGLLPNAAYYFSHRPAFYLRHSGEAERGFAPGLNSIVLTFDTVRLGSVQPGEERSRVNVIHLPVVTNSPSERRRLSALREQCAGERWALFLSTTGASEGAGRVLQDALGAARVFPLALSRRVAAGPDIGRPPLGIRCRWEAAVEERIPAVVRNPSSGLAREYVALCESMLNQINSMRRHPDRGQPLRHTRIRAARS